MILPCWLVSIKFKVYLAEIISWWSPSFHYWVFLPCALYHTTNDWFSLHILWFFKLFLTTFIFLFKHQTPAQIQAAAFSLLITTSSYRALYSKSALPCKVSTTPKFIHLKLEGFLFSFREMKVHQAGTSSILPPPQIRNVCKITSGSMPQHAKVQDPWSAWSTVRSWNGLKIQDSDQRHEMFCENHPN